MSSAESFKLQQEGDIPLHDIPPAYMSLFGGLTLIGSSEAVSC